MSHIKKIPRLGMWLVAAVTISLASPSAASAALVHEAKPTSEVAAVTTSAVPSPASLTVAAPFQKVQPSGVLVASATTKQAKASSCASVTLYQGNRGKCVKELQKLLLKKGANLASYGADGVFGKTTYKAVRKYQDRRGLKVDGIAGRQTWGELRRGNSTIKTPSKSSCYSKTIRRSSSGTCAKEAQKLLLKNGEWLGAYGADGVFGSVSARATEHYQDRYGLADDGIIGPKTWKKLRSGKVKTKHLNSKCFSGGSWACVDISDQITYVFKNGKLVKQMPSRTGGSFKHKGKWYQKKTPTGTFSVNRRVIDEVSNIYEDAKMPHSQYFTYRGHAFHGSASFTSDGNYINAKGKRQGSGGCVNLMLRDAKWLWSNFGKGDGVVVQK